MGLIKIGNGSLYVIYRPNENLNELGWRAYIHMIQQTTIYLLECIEVCLY